MTEIRKNGQTIHRSKNLRGILDHARRTGVRCAFVQQDADGGAVLDVCFSDDSHCRTSFADFSVCREWVKGRRSWRLTEKKNTETHYSYMVE